MLGISQFPVIPDYSMDILDKNRQDGHQPYLRQDSTYPDRHLEINLIKHINYE
jgi:hypothetical protein